VNASVRPAEPAEGNVLARLPYFVDWRPQLWVPAVRWLLGDPARFRGKRVLELGSRTGRMACLFGLLGAEVLGVDLPGVPLDGAAREAERWGLGDRVRFLSYGGDPASLPEGDFDFVFTKSVLVMIPELNPVLTALPGKMKPGGELLAVENTGGPVLNCLRRSVLHRGSEYLKRPHGVDAAFLATIGRVFERVEHRRFFWLVSTIRAWRR
jgi:SAM-dependent methyltransferase